MKNAHCQIAALTILLLIALEGCLDRMIDLPVPQVNQDGTVASPTTSRLATASSSSIAIDPPIATGTIIKFLGLEPDGAWIVFWIATKGTEEGGAAELSSPGELHFYNIEMHMQCGYPQFEAYMSLTGVEWEESRAIVSYEGARYEGQPCATEEMALTSASGTSSEAMEGALSLDGNYHAEARAGEGEPSQIEVVFTEVTTGTVVMTVDYVSVPGVGNPLPGGEWITDSLYLIYQTLDHGPLLIDLEAHQVHEVMPEYFQSPYEYTPELSFHAKARAADASDDFHVLLIPRGEEVRFPNVQIYHSETGEVEDTGYQHVYLGGFSPDGEWLLLDSRPQHAAPGSGIFYESHALYARPADPTGSSARLVAEGAAGAVFSPDGRLLAMADHGYVFGAPNMLSVYSFPEGDLLTEWETKEYVLDPVAWSLDGRRLIALGNIPGEYHAALYVLDIQS